MIFYTGLGWLVSVGLGLVILTEVGLCALMHDKHFITPQSWRVMSGYGVAALYCVALHFLLVRRERRKGHPAPELVHTLVNAPIWCWGVGYIALGFLRMMGTK
jgi:hypothetical protein